MFRNKYNKYTILLQGKVNKETLSLWIKNHQNSKVVLSVWEDEDLSSYQIPKSWEVVVNQYPLIRFAPNANLDYQIISTLRGLGKVQTKWVIKMRCDEYWSNLDKVYQKMVKSPQKLITASMFFRKWGTYTKFHPSDKLIGGTLDNLIGMFESTLHNLEIGVWSECKTPESQLGLGYVMLKESNFEFNQLQLRMETDKKKFNDLEAIKAISNCIGIIGKETIDMAADYFSRTSEKNINWDVISKKLINWKNMLSECVNLLVMEEVKLIDDKPYMRKWFDVIDINELQPYIATRNFGPDRGRVWYRNDFVNEDEECLTNLND